MSNYNKITALYSRLSVGDEDRDGGESNSIQNQKIFLENYAKGQHLTNIRHYIDDDESGRFFDRSAYSRMIEDVESGKIVSAICHGVCGLLNVGLSDGQLLVAGKKITGFSWFEETLARRKKVVPFDLEAVLKERGADYRKAWIPMTSKVVVDGTLITGQNPLSSKEMAKVVLNHLTKREIR